MKVLVVADHVEKIKVQGDSTLVLVQEAFRRGHEVYWALGDDIHYAHGEVLVHAGRVEEASQDSIPLLGMSQTGSLEQMDVVLIRKDPPFDAGYVKLCWMLCFCEQRVWMMNRPSLLLRYHEKLVPFEAHAQGFLRKEDLVPTFMGAVDQAREYFSQYSHSQVVTKPFLGYGGRGVEKHEVSSWNSESGSRGGQNWNEFIQPFEKEVLERGDRRVFFLDGRLIGDFVRMPAEGGFISNLAQGGRALLSSMTPAEKEACLRLGKFLNSAGIVIAGADLIGAHISEVNITSPTGLKHLDYLEGNDRGEEIISFIEEHATKFKES